jgi:release factor glutamine methyltransferase
LTETGIAPTVHDALAGAAARLADAGCDTPRLDAELLLASAWGVDRARLVLEAGAPLGLRAANDFEALIDRRAAREPVAYILGRKEFRMITLAVDERVLVPRPETELLVEVGLSLPAGARVVDVGTGSGAVALALKAERPDLSIIGTDLSADALTVARSNAGALALDVELVQADLLDGLEPRFDAVLANLPYVASGAELPPEVARYEPPEALFAGPDGLDVIRRLVPAVVGTRLVALEVGFDQARAVEELARGAGFSTVEVLHDLAGHERVVVGRA